MKEVGYFRKLFSNGLMAGLFGCVASNFLDLLKVRIIEQERGVIFRESFK